VLKVDGLNRIPDNVGFDEASAAEPFACAINAQELLGIEERDTVVVFGAGPIGCMHIRIARANGSAPEHNKRALEYISTGPVPVKDLITRHILLDNVLDAFGIVSGGEAIKVTVEPK